MDNGARAEEFCTAYYIQRITNLIHKVLCITSITHPKIIKGILQEAWDRITNNLTEQNSSYAPHGPDIKESLVV